MEMMLSNARACPVPLPAASAGVFEPSATITH